MSVGCICQTYSDCVLEKLFRLGGGGGGEGGEKKEHLIISAIWVSIDYSGISVKQMASLHFLIDF